MKTNFSLLMSIYHKESVANFENCMRSITAPYQTTPPTEIILIEDGPLPKELKESIERWKEKKVNLITKPLSYNQGLAKALNIGLQACSYELVARMDTDDEAMPDRFEKQLAFMLKNPNISVSSSYIHECDYELKKTLFKKILPLEHKELKEFCKTRSPINHPVSIFRKTDVLNSGGYPEIYPEDYALWGIMISKGYILGNIPHYLLKMRSGKSMLKRRGIKFLKGEIQIYKKFYSIGLINKKELYKSIIAKIIVRAQPNFTKTLIYKFFR